MITVETSGMLRSVLYLDAVCCAAMGIAMSACSEPLAPLMGLPAALLLESGWLLLPIAAFIAYLASRQRPARVLVWTVIVLNAVWVVQSCALLLTDWIAPNAAGYAFVIGQAAVTAVFAELEYLGLRNSAVVAYQCG